MPSAVRSAAAPRLVSEGPGGPRPRAPPLEHDQVAASFGEHRSPVPRSVDRLKCPRHPWCSSDHGVLVDLLDLPTPRSTRNSTARASSPAVDSTTQLLEELPLGHTTLLIVSNHGQGIRMVRA